MFGWNSLKIQPVREIPALMAVYHQRRRFLIKSQRLENVKVQDILLSCYRLQEGRPDNSRGEQLSTSSSNKKSLNKDKKASGKYNAKILEAEKKDDCKKEAPFRIKCHQKAPSKSSNSKLGKTESTEQNVTVTADRLSGNPTIVGKTLDQILADDPTVTEVNLNNIEDISQDTLLRFVEALCTNTHVHIFSLSNTHADDRVAFAMSKMLCENRSIRNLNIESNYITGQGLLSVLAALRHNKTLVELRFHNQRHICGGKVEMEMVQLLRENTTLLKLGYQFDLPGPRMTATSILTRNQDQQRQRRLQQKEEQRTPEVSGQVGASSAENRPTKKPWQYPKVAVENQRCPPPSSYVTTRKIAETVKQHESLNSVKGQVNQRKPKTKKAKNDSGEKDSADILKELRNALKPSLQRRREETAILPPQQRSGRDDLMAAIRGSSIGSLRRVSASLSPLRFQSIPQLCVGL